MDTLIKDVASVKVDMNDVYRPSLDGIGVDVEEDSGDSEDTSVGATDVFGLRKMIELN